MATGRPATYEVQRSARDAAVQTRRRRRRARRRAQGTARGRPPSRGPSNLQADVARLSAPPRGDRPVTLGIGEPFTTTVTVSLSLRSSCRSPVLLLQAYGFLTPAFEPDQRRRVRPLRLAVPVLFVGGLAFGYFAVLPAAVRFFQNFNSNEFDVSSKRASTTSSPPPCCSRWGSCSKFPVGILATTRSGLVSVRLIAPAAAATPWCYARS